MKILGIILGIVILIPSVCCAKPFITTDPTSCDVTEWIVIIDGTAHPVAPQDLGDGTFRLHYDLAPLGLASGNHNATIKAVNDLWDLETATVPFDFNKPASLEDPAGIGLSAE